jgi:polysaccharide deacetylase 2 family uncharacterized protein YibQ
MARKNPIRKKKGGKRAALWIFLFLLLLGGVAATAYLLFLRPGTAPRLSPPLSAVSKKKPPRSHAEPVPPAAPSVRKTPPPASGPMVSIIIDDMGFKDKVCVELIGLDLNLSFAFLPFGPHTAAQLALAHAGKRDILVHVPMEPQDSKWVPGQGALYTAMNAREIRQALEQDIAAIPHAVGINNHMGSRFTEQRAGMQACLALLRQHDLFFVDSATSARSVGFALAREMDVKTARRDIFLDNSLEPGKIRLQLDALFDLARKKGTAIGIGHPHQATLDVLRQYQAALPDNIRLVGVSRLTK